MIRLIYGKGPAALGYQNEYILVEARALEKLDAAAHCRTWGEFAASEGCTFEHLLESWREEMTSINGGREPTRESPLNFPSLWGVWDIGDLVDDPRTVAYEALPAVFHNGLDERLEEEIVVSFDEPFGESACVTALTKDAFKHLSVFLKANGCASIRLENDEAALKHCFETFPPEPPPEDDGPAGDETDAAP